MKITVRRLKQLIKESAEMNPAAQLLDKVVATIEEEGGSTEPFDYTGGHHPEEYRASVEITNKPISTSIIDAISRTIGDRPRNDYEGQSQWLTKVGGTTAVITLFGERELEVAVMKPRKRW